MGLERGECDVIAPDVFKMGGLSLYENWVFENVRFLAVSLSLFPLSWTSFEFSGEVQVWFPKREVLFSHVTSKYSWKVLLNQLSIPSRLANVLVEY